MEKPYLVWYIQSILLIIRRIKMTRFLVQYFSKTLINSIQSDAFKIYEEIGRELIQLLFKVSIIKENNVIYGPCIVQRPEFGIHYEESEGLFQHGVFVFDSGVDHFVVKEML